MSAQTPGSKVRFSDEDELDAEVERQLKRKYGRGVFVEGWTETRDGTLFVSLGNAAPKDVSDCRDHDRVLKFIEYESIYRLEAEPVESGYVIDLPDREAVYEGFLEEKKNLAQRLDRSMARAIYEKLVTFPEVEHQLGAIKSILRTVREEGPIDVETIHAIRGSTPSERQKTEAYLRILIDKEFLRLETRQADESDGATQHTLEDEPIEDELTDHIVRSGPNLDTHDENEVGTREFTELVLGHVVDEAYNTLKNERNLTLLAHYPKYASAYYFTALERGEPSVRLDATAAKENIETLYEDDEHEVLVRQKLDDLAEVGVVRKDGEFYQSAEDVYQTLSEQAVV